MTIELPSYRWVASPCYSSRNGARVKLIVVHDCEGSYGGSVAWFARTESQVSAHVVLSEDGMQATQMVGWGNKAWHVCAFNGFSEGIEAAGYAAKGLGAPEWQALANLTALRLRANSIPCQRATANNNWTGFCQHADLGVAGGGHHDITNSQDKLDAFEQMVWDAYRDPVLPNSWGGEKITAPVAMPANFTPSGTVRHDLIVGSIEWVQMRLNALHIPINTLSVDGLEGPLTERAIQLFQMKSKIWVDGVAGPETVKALQAAT